MAINKDYKGDGLIFAKAVQGAGLTVLEVMDKLKISKGTLYNYYNSLELGESIKKSIGEMLGLDGLILFGLKPTAPNKAENSNKQNDENQDFGTKLGVSLSPPNKPADNTHMEDLMKLALLQQGTIDKLTTLLDAAVGKIPPSQQQPNINYKKPKKAEGATEKVK